MKTPEVRFAPDSVLEQSVFELWVPPACDTPGSHKGDIRGAHDIVARVSRDRARHHPRNDDAHDAERAVLSALAAHCAAHAAVFSIGPLLEEVTARPLQREVGPEAP